GGLGGLGDGRPRGGSGVAFRLRSLVQRPPRPWRARAPLRAGRAGVRWPGPAPGGPWVAPEGASGGPRAALDPRATETLQSPPVGRIASNSGSRLPSDWPR